MRCPVCHVNDSLATDSEMAVNLAQLALCGAIEKTKRHMDKDGRAEGYYALMAAAQTAARMLAGECFRCNDGVQCVREAF